MFGKNPVEVEAFTIRFLSDKLFEDRLTLCSNEELNGLELWRNLGLRFSGEGKQAVMTSGLQTFMKLGRCESEHHLLSHVTEWEKYLNTYATHLKQDKATLRTLVLALLPKEMEDKLTHKMAKYPTYIEIMDHVRQKAELRRQLLIADSIHKNKGVVAAARGSTVNGLSERPMTESRIAPAPQAAKPMPIAPTMQDLANMMAAVANGGGGNRQRPTRTGDRTDPRKGNRFTWKKGKCWECGAEDHIRPQCPQWLSIIDGNGKPPLGHKGAKDRALQAFKERKQKEKSHMKALGYDTGEMEVDTENEDDDSDADQVFALGAQCPNHWSTDSEGELLFSS